MAIKLTQSLKQTQTLAMTPQLQQAIKLLTLTHLEMTDLIAEEMVENPMLEEAGNETDPDRQKSEDDYNIEKLENQNVEAHSDNFDEPGIVNRERDDFDWNTYVDSFNSTSSSPPSMVKQDFDELPNYENIVSSGQSLADHLEWQLRMENLSNEQWSLAEEIIHNINNDGYLETEFEEILSHSNLSREDAYDVLYMVQNLDPVGCGAQNLEECLLAQARIAHESSPLLETVIKEHLTDLKNKDHEKIAKELGVPLNKIKEMEFIIQGFHPRPGRLVATEETHYVVPDIYVVQVAGEFQVYLNDEGVPRLRISKFYQSLFNKHSKETDKEAKEFVQEKLRSAMWLIKSIQNRQRTIIKVAKAIVAQQQDFFKKGPKYLKPMILKDVANEIGMHESTVSRVTTNKYMHTPIGLFELKYFFNAGIGGKHGGVDVSSEVLKLKIKELIDNENPAKPLSDQKIASLLSRDDLAVARRTVAKYREMMDIPSSARRKKKA